MIRQTAMRSVVALDLGQQGDFSALAWLQFPAAVRKPTYQVPTLKRWPLSTSYTNVGCDVARFLLQPVLEGAELVIDATGVGLAVVELVSRELVEAYLRTRIISVTITGGNTMTQVEGRKWNVSKRQLVSTLSAVVHGGRMQVAQDLPEAAALIREMAVFKTKINLTTGNESFEAWRERDHDDLVLAVALAVWWPEWPRPVCGAY